MMLIFSRLITKKIINIMEKINSKQYLVPVVEATSVKVEDGFTLSSDNKREHKYSIVGPSNDFDPEQM